LAVCCAPATAAAAKSSAAGRIRDFLIQVSKTFGQ
jgi:hypothetical protein